MENTPRICPKIVALHNSLRRFVSETVAELRYHTHEFRNDISNQQNPVNHRIAAPRGFLAVTTTRISH